MMEGEEPAEVGSNNTPLLPKRDDDRAADPPGAIARYYTLPRTRYRNIAEAVLIIDTIVSLALWLSGKCVDAV